MVINTDDIIVVPQENKVVLVGLLKEFMDLILVEGQMELVLGIIMEELHLTMADHTHIILEQILREIIPIM